MDWAGFAIHWLHVLGGIFWFGGALYGNIVLFPVVLKLPEPVQRAVMSPLLPAGDRVILPVAIATILLGVLRGTVLGRIHALADLTTAYGIAWLVGLATAIIVLGLGIYLSNEAKRLMSSAEGGAAYMTAGRGLQVAAIADLLGFFVIFTAMISMRFL
jgi:uncharacterized membrane protein